MLFKTLQIQIKCLDTSSISSSRKNLLQPLIDFIQAKVDAGQPIKLNFICTHNSRRSHLSQVWAQALGHFYNIKTLFCYSGGTESTALFPAAARALETSGFKIDSQTHTKNPLRPSSLVQKPTKAAPLYQALRFEFHCLLRIQKLLITPRNKPKNIERAVYK